MTRTHTWRRTIRLVRNRAHDIRLNPLSKTLATQHNNKRSTTGDFSELSHVYNVSCWTTQRVRCGRDRTDDLCIATHQSSGTLGGVSKIRLFRIKRDETERQETEVLLPAYFLSAPAHNV